MGRGEIFLKFKQLFLVCKRDEGSYLGNHKCLDFSRVNDMRANTQINHGTTAIYSRGGTIRNLGFDQVLFEFVVLND